MQRKHIIVLGLLVVVPLFAFLLLGRRLVQADQARTQRQFESLLDANLATIDRSIRDYFDAVQQRLLVGELDADDVDSLRAFTRFEPLVEQIFLLDSEGTLAYPDPNGSISEREAGYLLKIEQLINDRTLVRQESTEQVIPSTISDDTPPSKFRVLLRKRPMKVTLSKGQSVPMADAYTPSSPSSDHGWYTWYWGNGIQLIHWRVLDDDRILAIGLLRARWMADVIAMLPDSVSDEDERSTSPAQVRLSDTEGKTVYLWGANKGIPEDAAPVTSLRLSAPLRPWQLQHFGPSSSLDIGMSGTLINMLAMGGLLASGLLGLAIYLSREIGRETREARQRVNFVNQVSHELKTPLTNIRMYADMLENDLDRIDPDDANAQSHLAVITSESGRLSRLINNVLTYARTNHNTAAPRIQSGSVDEVIAVVIEQFRPSLDKLGIEVVLDLDAQDTVALDVDSVEQMLGNLISNVEKYAADGKHMRIASRLRDDETTIDVSDAGAGISPSFAKRIFEPFERASDHIVSATGTGIGLGITRTLARRHGGDLILKESAIGASFRLTLKTPRCDESNS